MSAKKQSQDRYKEIRNKKVFRDYTVEDRFEAGIVLTGTEVKSIRLGRAQLSDSHARINSHNEVFLYHLHVAEYTFGTDNNHPPYRPRKLLLHKREIFKLQTALQSGGRTLVPLRIYFKKGLIKVELGICVGKKQFDKREDLKKKAEMREVDRALRGRD